MRGAPKVILIMAILFFVSILFGELTGGAFRTTSTGEILGERPERSDLEFTRIEILGEEIGEEGLPIFKRGDIISFIIEPGKNGVHTGFQIENAISGLRFEGGHCHPGTTGDFCSNSYPCVGGDCGTVGSKCFGQKLVSERIPEYLKSGEYVVSVCDGSDECCKFEIRAPFIVV